jgi:hypothetical protein
MGDLTPVFPCSNGGPGVLLSQYRNGGPDPGAYANKPCKNQRGATSPDSPTMRSRYTQ